MDACTLAQGHTHWGIHQAALWLVDQEGDRIAGAAVETPCLLIKYSC